jgi:transcription initiation factor TFIID subunit 6
VTKIFTTSLQDERAALASHYGALSGLGELGTEVRDFSFANILYTQLHILSYQVIKAFLLPYVKAEGERLQYIFEGVLINNADRIAADHVKQTLLVIDQSQIRSSQ